MKFLIVFIALVKLSATQHLSEDVVKYINKQIDKLLQENPLKDGAEIKLNLEFNRERMLLQSTKFNATTEVEQGAETQAQHNMQRFIKFNSKFQEILSQVTQAIDELDNLQQNKNLILGAKYEALSLKIRLQDCRTIKEAEKVLKAYQKFKKERVPTENSGLSEEQQKCLEEITELLKKLSLYEKPKMQEGLQELKSHPKHIKTLADSLRTVKDMFQDYEKYEVYVVDFLESFFG